MSLHLVGAAARLRPQHAEGGTLRPRPGHAGRPGHGAHDRALLSLHLCLRQTRRPSPKSPPSTIRGSRNLRVGRAAHRRRRRQLAARRMLWPAAASSVSCAASRSMATIRGRNPPARIVEAVAAARSTSPSSGDRWPAISPPGNRWPCGSRRSPRRRRPELPMIFDISMGVRRGDEALRRELDAALAKHRPRSMRS